MFYLLVLLSLVLSVYSEDLTLAVTENDPSSLVEGVSVITGDLYALEDDYVVQGAEPIRLRRSFISRDGVFKGYQHLTATFACTINQLFVNEHNGTTLFYYPDSKNQIHPLIGSEFYGEKKRDRKILRYNAYDFTQAAKGVSNTSSGKISAETHLKNQYIVFDPNSDEEGKSFTLHASDGTKRRYVNFEGQKRASGYPFKGLYISYEYKLVSESLPNGHIIHYHWTSDNQIDRIFTTNRAQTKTFAYIHIPKSKTSSTEITLTGSDGRSITYKGQPTTDVISPEFPDHHFDWEMKPRRFRGEDKKMAYLSKFSLKQNRSMAIGYSDVEDPASRQAKIDERLNDIRKQIKELKPKAKKKPNKYKHKLNELKAEEESISKNGIENEGVYEGYFVKKLSSPVGKDEALLTTHTFVYDKPNKTSYVLDAKNNKTAYFWNDDYRLTRVERYVGVQEFHSADTFLWENTHLRCKTLYDQSLNPISSRILTYDGAGNVKTETFYGNLSGEGPQLKIGTNGFPEENGIERSVKTTTTSEDGRNLPLKQEESCTRMCVKYTYRDDCHLPKAKTICEGDQEKIKTTYEYDADLILSSETIDDGISRLVKKITPYEIGSYVGMPKIIEEFYGKEILLRKTVLHYGKGGSIEQKDIYDAHDKIRFSLKMTYDDKGRLTSETNANNQKAIYEYDEVGNRKYAKDFSGRLETFYTYDCSNRLIQKEEKRDDGLSRKYVYIYDTKHNLISETDPYGNTTTYLPDAFGRHKEIHQPSVLNENGELVHSILKFEYDSAGNEIKKEDPEGNVIQTTYNAYGKPILITHPDEAFEQFSYYPDGNLKTYTDPKKVITSYEYDYLGRVVKKTTATAEETFEYTGQYLTKKTDAEKNETIYKYDLAGRKISEEFAGEKSIYTYDEFGRIKTTQNGDLVLVNEYDLLGRITEERNESVSGEVFRKVRYEYDAAGNRKATIRSIDGKEAREEFKYDSLGRMIEKKDPLGYVETVEYDTKINQKTHTDPLGLQTIETYNSRNQLASVEKKKGGKSLALEKRYYNKNGARSLQIDTIYTPAREEREIRTRWEYNSRGQLKKLTEADGTLNAKITQYEYTPRGEIETLTKPNGVVLTYRYNDLGHLQSLSSSDGTVDHSMEYNRLGHLQKSDDLVRKTDPLGRILKEKFPRWHTIENTYDQIGRRDTCKIPHAGCLITYDYDPVNLKTVTRKTLNGTTLYSHSYTKHDLSGNVLEEELIQNGGTLQLTYDQLSRKTAITSPQFTQKVLEFDPTSHILKMQIGVEEISYTYDDLYQLTSESGLFAHNYVFDSLNNRLQKDEERYQINPLNQTTSHFSYNRNGNPIQFGDTIYTYDALDRLIRIETPEFVQTFIYDSLNRCLSKTTVRSGDPKTIYFIYDRQNEIGALDESAVPLELRILGNTPHAEIGAAIAIELSGKAHIPIHDLQGNLAALQPIDSEPTLYRYSAFGEEKIFGKALSSWRFSSKRTDDESHLVYFGRRYYIPSFGRWLTPDPAGFTDGMNLYSYVHNDPLTHFDEYGLIMTARDYKTVQQITSTPWEGERPWGTVSHYARNFASKMTHDLYDTYMAPLQYDFDRSVGLFSGRTQASWGRSQAIDEFFGTSISASNQRRDQYREMMGMQFAETGIPFGPGGLLSGAGKVSTAVNRVLRNSKALSPAIKLSSSGINKSFNWNPITGSGPLDPKVASSFRSSTYMEHTLREPTLLYRVYSDPSKMLGRFWSRTNPSGSLQSILDHALHPEFGNLATRTVKIRVPKGTRLFEGIVAPQGGLLGGGNQIFLQTVNQQWIVP